MLSWLNEVGGQAERIYAADIYIYIYIFIILCRWDDWSAGWLNQRPTMEAMERIVCLDRYFTGNVIIDRRSGGSREKYEWKMLPSIILSIV